MKYFKRLVFAALLAVGAIFLVACGSTTSDNGKYVYKAEKDQIKSILKKQGATDEQLEKVIDQFDLTMTIEIKDTKAKMIIEMKALEEKVKYKIDGDVLTLDVSKAESSDYEVFAFFKDAKFKRQK